MLSADAAYERGYADARRHAIAGEFYLPSQRSTLARRVLEREARERSDDAVAEHAVADYCRGYAEREAAHWRER